MRHPRRPRCLPRSGPSVKLLAIPAHDTTLGPLRNSPNWCWRSLRLGLLIYEMIKTSSGRGPLSETLEPRVPWAASRSTRPSGGPLIAWSLSAVFCGQYFASVDLKYFASEALNCSPARQAPAPVQLASLRHSAHHWSGSFSRQQP
jgi:hypothetical protein